MIDRNQVIVVPGVTFNYLTHIFAPPSLAVRPRVEPVRVVVLHHTAAENPHTTVIHTLKSRTSGGAPEGLSVHFIIDRAGVVHQTADLSLVTLHAGRANPFSVGIEIVSRGQGTAAPGKPREAYRALVRGRYVRYLKFYSEQLKAAKLLTRALCQHYGIPYEVPRDFNGKVSTAVLSLEQMATYHGVLGHLHITNSKVDPSIHLLEEIAGNQ